MIDLSTANLSNLVIHRVGNKSEAQEIRFSKSPIRLKDSLIKDLVVKYFTSHFSFTELYHLAHDGKLNLNEVYTYSTEIFDDKQEFYNQSVNLAKHLYEQTSHPKIKAGELYIAYFTGCTVDGTDVDAIGLFKSESRETYLKVYPTDENFEIDYEDGININKLDKGAIIFNIEKDNGYLVAIIDTVSKGYEAQYWKDDFLHVRSRQDEYNHTKNALNLCKNFVIECLPDEFDIIKADQVDILNRSMKFFKEKEKFNIKEFSDEVIGQPEMIDSFKSYKRQYQSDHQVQVEDDFEISAPAVKKQNRYFRSIIKLDKNFHIYVHGSRQMIEKGKDETTGMNYYKLFFKDEA
jgi:hypothetical protein